MSIQILQGVVQGESCGEGELEPEFADKEVIFVLLLDAPREGPPLCFLAPHKRINMLCFVSFVNAHGRVTSAAGEGG